MVNAVILRGGGILKTFELVGISEHLKKNDMGNHSKDKKQLAFTLTYAEYALIKLMADKAGANISEYLTGLLQDLYVCYRLEWNHPKRFGIYVEAELREAVSEEAMFEDITIGEFIKRIVLKDFDISQE